MYSHEIITQKRKFMPPYYANFCPISLVHAESASKFDNNFMQELVQANVQLLGSAAKLVQHGSKSK